MLSVAPQTVPVSIRYVLPILRELESLGCPTDRIFQQWGIRPAKSRRAPVDLNLPVLEFTKLYSQVLRLLQETNQAPSDDGRHILSKDELAMICSLAAGCSDLRAAIDSLSTFSRITGGSLQLVVHDRMAQLQLWSHVGKRDESDLILTLATMIFHHQLFSWLIGRRIGLERLLVKSSKPTEPMPMLEVLDAPISYGQNSNLLVFPAEYLELPVIRSPADLKHVIDFMPFDIWYSGHCAAALNSRIRMIFMSALESGASMKSIAGIAELFHMSQATLRRRLLEEGTTYAAIKASCQRDFSEYLLRCTKEPMDQIAVRVGYRDDRAFRRAFRQWTDLCPSEYRSRAGAKHVWGLVSSFCYIAYESSAVVGWAASSIPV